MTTADERARWAAYMREWRASRKRLMLEDPSLVPHGTRDGYVNWGCRCQDCATANHSDARARVEGQGITYGSYSNRYRNATRGSSAPNAGKQWTGAEMDIATERDGDGNYVRTTAQVADMVGRSRVAVQRLRHRCLHDSKLQRVIGSQG